MMQQPRPLQSGRAAAGAVAQRPIVGASGAAASASALPPPLLATATAAAAPSGVSSGAAAGAASASVLAAPPPPMRGGAPLGSRRGMATRRGAGAPRSSSMPARGGGAGGVPPSTAAAAAPPAAAPSSKAAASTATAAPGSGGGGSSSAKDGAGSPPSSPGAATRSGNGTAPKGPSSPVTFDKAMAAKINAARELARRLAEERGAATAAASARGTADGESMRAAEAASAEAAAAAAAQAAKADALVRALRRAESNRDSLTRLRAENEALRELLLEVAADKDAARARMEAVLSSLSDQTLVERAKATVGGGGAATAAGASAATAAAPTFATGTAAPTSAAKKATDATGAAASAAATAAATATAATAGEVETQLVAASAQVAESLSPSKAAVAPPPEALQSEDVAISLNQARAVLSAVQQAKEAAAGGVGGKEAAVKDAVKKMEQAAVKKEKEAGGGAAAAPSGASAAATAAVETLHAGEPAVKVKAPAPAAGTGAAAPVAQKKAAPAAAAAPAAPAAAAAAAAAAVIEVEVEVEEAVEEAAAAAPLPPVPEPTAAQLQERARAATAAGKLVFVWPPEGGLVGRPARIYYNRARGPLPPSNKLQMKVGFNKWEEIALFDMEPAQGLASGGGQDWWVLGVELPLETFRFDYVIMDAASGAVDNNGWKDYELPLADAPSEDEVMAARAEAYERFDQDRRKLIEEEEKRLWRQVESKALDAAAAARVEFRKRRDAELLAAARQVVADRRKADLFAALPAADSKAGVYAWCGGPPRAGARAFLAYNKIQGGQGGGLPHAGSGIRVHLGYDNWWNKISQAIDLSPLAPEDVAAKGLAAGGGAQWWGCWVDVPYSAAVLNFVFSDREQRMWDNNGQRDFHTKVAGAHSGEELVDMLYGAMKKDSAEADKEVEDRAALRAVRKVEAKGLTMRKRREVVHEFLYTVPLSPKSGQVVDVYYRPEATMLRGRPEIWLRASWNRGANNRGAPELRPLTARLLPCLPGGLGFYKASVPVPATAWGLDLSFSDSEAMGGGFLDDNGGLEYHVPVEASAKPRQMLKIVHVAVEMAPIAKVGGMGDVVTALGRAVQEQGHDVSVMLPKYDCINYDLVEDLVQEGTFSWGGTTVRVWRGGVEGLDTVFLEPENGMFWVGCIYGRNNDAQRFAFFCGAALQYLKNQAGPGGRGAADIIHCHDWQSAPVAYGDRGQAKTVFTIHNLSYGADLIGRAMQACQVATTVSPTYAREIAGHPSVAAHLNKLYGVLNGIDQDIWDPSEDPCLPLHYSADNVAAGKEAARKALRQKLGLVAADVPIVGCVTRLVAQKGIHLIKHAAWRTLERGGQFVLLGSAPDGRVQGEFNALRDQLARAYPDRAALIFTYDEPLSHLIYAGSDMFLVPSMFEPCGLTQMIAMRYGTIPVVRKTGGLVDTVYDVDHDEDRARLKGMDTNGFSFEGTDFAGMDYALNRALSVWYSDRALWQSLRRRAMTQDWSWNSPALDYVELYYKALKS
ncbi:hypothetical protein HYH02_010668 [Chlamydomonas schloesseri]|uniref:starch synthase n=1 Tax=Chlamydomonas schloesseri TaxID=2026947 RepID=A0A835THK9_9CHLO|nr:hypothetical protein HYH02_010668 [Chlamydomonas schloesseri]|eukprot:KAG2438870.1 hypothetical protein HYH02_010668 [Chlamydomonas schloesseri]